jgi:hypothetical protein
MRSKSCTASEVNVCSQGKQQRFGLRWKGGFPSTWMSRLEVVVGWDWAGAMGAMLCFPKARRMGAIASASLHGAIMWAESSPEAASFPATSSGSVPGPPGSNVIGIWLARVPGAPARSWKDGGEHTAREHGWRERGTGEGDGGRAFSTARGTALALAGSTGWQALTQVWLAGMSTIQVVRTRLLALICSLTRSRWPLHGFMRSILRILASATTRLATRLSFSQLSSMEHWQWQWPGRGGRSLKALLCLEAGGSLPLQRWDGIVGWPPSPSGGVPGEVSCAAIKANSTPESGHYAKGPPHGQ